MFINVSLISFSSGVRKVLWPFRSVVNSETAARTFVFLEVICHVSGGDHFMSEKRTKKFAGKIYFLDFGNDHGWSFRLG